MSSKKDECCPEFDPKKWDEREFNWDEMDFIKESIPTLFHMPFPPIVGKKLTKMMALAEAAKRIDSKKDEVLILFQDQNAFKSNIYISVTGDVPEGENVIIPGKFFAKIYEGPFNAIPKFVKDMNAYLEKKGKKVPKNSDYYIHYCAPSVRRSTIITT